MKKVESMNVVPFIDIMLVLLVIVLTTASFVQTSKLPISIPQVDKDSTDSKDVLDKNKLRSPFLIRVLFILTIKKSALKI